MKEFSTSCSNAVKKLQLCGLLIQCDIYFSSCHGGLFSAYFKLLLFCVVQYMLLKKQYSIEVTSAIPLLTFLDYLKQPNVLFKGTLQYIHLNLLKISG